MRKNVEVNVFKKRYLIPPDKIEVVNYVRKTPSAVFNPAAFLRNGKVLIFPRLIFDYYKYTSAIGMFEIDLNDLLNGKVDRKFETKIIIWPHDKTDFLGCEDPRIHIHEGIIYMLYTGKGFELNDDTQNKRTDYLYLVKMDENFNILERRYFSVLDEEGKTRIPISNKDSAFIRINGDNATMLTRAELKKKELFCYSALADLDRMILRDLKVLMKPEEWEIKIGWSTNTVKLKYDEYLVGWHAVLIDDFSYKNGFAIVNEKGEMLAVSDYMLFTVGLNEEYGDRALVIFGDGLILFEDKLIWIGGVCDFSVGIFIAELNDVLTNMRSI